MSTELTSQVSLDEFKQVAKIDDVLSELKNVHAHNSAVDSQLEQLKAERNIGCAISCSAPIAWFVGIVLKQSRSGEQLALFLMLLGFVLIVVGIVRVYKKQVAKNKLAATKLPAYRVWVLQYLLELLSADIPEEQEISVSVDFEEHNAEAFLLEEGKVSYWDVKYHSHDWLNVQCRLLDGSKLDLSVTEKQQDRHRTKRSASGKLKHKYKTKSSSLVSARIRFKEKNILPSVANSDEASTAIRIPGAELRKVNASQTEITVVAKYPLSIWNTNDEEVADGKNPFSQAATQRIANVLVGSFNYLNSHRVK